MHNKYPVRKNIRLHGHDYSSTGHYFLTICVKDRHELLGRIVVGTTVPGRPSVELTPIGECVEETIQNANRNNVIIDKYVIMPNHGDKFKCAVIFGRRRVGKTSLI